MRSREFPTAQIPQLKQPAPIGASKRGPAQRVASKSAALDRLRSAVAEALENRTLFSFVTVSSLMANESAGVEVFKATLDAPTTVSTSISYHTINGSAKAGKDYVATASLFTIPGGATSTTFSVPLIDDNVHEPGEKFFVRLAPAPGSGRVTPRVAATIADDDAIPTVSIGDTQIVEPRGGGRSSGRVLVQLSNPTASPVKIQFATSDGSAIAGSDYERRSGTLTIRPGALKGSIGVNAMGDRVVESNETYKLNVTGAVNAAVAAGTFGTVTIIDNAATAASQPVISISNPSANGTNGGSVAFQVALSSASTKSVHVAFATADGTAHAGADYAATSGVLDFIPGQTSQTVVVPLLANATATSDLNFTLQLFGGQVGSASGTATITRNNALVLPSVSVSGGAVAEGDTGTSSLFFNVSLSSPSESTVNVDFATSDNTATAGSDYVPASGTVTFAPHETAKSVAVTVNGDTTVESDETVRLTLSNPVNATIAAGSALGRISDDDSVASATPTLSVSGGSVTEGNSGTRTLNFTVALSVAATSAVTVDFATNGSGTATAGVDFVATSGTLTFQPGQVTRTIPVTVNGDTTAESNETVGLRISNPANAVIATGSAAGTIIDDDSGGAGPTLSVTGGSVAEGNSGTSVLNFTVTLSATSASAVTVDFATDATGNATAGTDFIASMGTLTFAPGETTKTIPIAVNGDTTPESNETVGLILSNPTNATIATGSATGTILDDDTPGATPSLSVTGGRVAEGNSGTSTLDFTVTLSISTGSPVTVDFATNTHGNATAGTDFVAGNGTVTFAPGETSKTIPVTVNGDTLIESDETVGLTLSNPINANIATGTALGTILDDDTPGATPILSVSGGNVLEGNSGTSTLNFTVTLSAAAASPVTVGFATDGSGTASPGTDFVATSGTLTFAPGETSKTIPVTVNGDTTPESNETVGLTLSNPTNASIATASATGTITDDDTAPASPTLSVAGNNVAEGNSGANVLNFTVSLSAPATSVVTVGFATNTDGTATPGTDFVATNGTLTFNVGESSKIVPVTVNGDTDSEPNETVGMTLSNPTNAMIVTGSAFGTIIDDDSGVMPGLSVSGGSVMEGDSGTNVLNFTVTLSAASASVVTVDFATDASGTATPGADFVATSGTLTFAVGETSKIVPVTVNGDTIVEPDETVALTLSNPTNAIIVAGSATGTIVNDD